MKAAVLEQYNEFRITEKPLPAMAANEVMVRVHYASICGSDQHLFKGDFHPRTKLPFTPGHEFAGVVEKTGDEVTGYKSGDKVAVDPIIWCGACDACKAGHFPACEKLRLIGIDQDGGFAQYICVPSSMLYKVPPGVSHQHAALVEVYGIGFHACKRAAVKQGDRIAIYGGGKVGQCVMQAARTKSKGQMFVVDVVEGRLEMIRQSYPEVRVINALREDPVQVIRNETEGKGVDVAFEVVGHAVDIPGRANPVRACVQSIRGGGTVCVLGLGDEAVPVVFKELIWKEARIVASRVSHGEFAEAIAQLEQGHLKPDALISALMPVDDIQKAFDLLDTQPDNYLKILLDLK
ncbi:MAG: alcohol dehydrogenase catalytic domain-containing protein [Cyclobacteriaceae bacterium]|nr:alcohol dehydrogenase catalytic domain-containing protein [Cyclobacteriaceae bacterium]